MCVHALERAHVCVCVNCVSGTVLSNGTTMVNKRVKIPALMELAFL